MPARDAGGCYFARRFASSIEEHALEEELEILQARSALALVEEREMGRREAEDALAAVKVKSSRRKKQLGRRKEQRRELEEMIEEPVRRDPDKTDSSENTGMEKQTDKTVQVSRKMKKKMRRQARAAEREDGDEARLVLARLDAVEAVVRALRGTKDA